MLNKKYLKHTLCIILLNYNNNADTIECVRSIYNSEKIELPFIVIVDNSEHNTGLIEKLQFYSNIEVLFPGRNLGFAEGNNYGIEWAMNEIQFEYLFVLNNDTLVMKDTIYKILTFAIENPAISVYTPCVITNDNPALIWYAGGEVNHLKMTPRVYNIEKEHNTIKLKSGLTYFASGCSIFISTKGYNLTEKLFDPFFFMYDEDLEFSIRLGKKNTPIYFLSNCIVIHKCQGSQYKNGYKTNKINQLSPVSKSLLFYLKHTIKNRYYIIDKHFTSFNWFRANLILTSYWLFKIIQFLLYLKVKASLFVLREILRYNFLHRPANKIGYMLK